MKVSHLITCAITSMIMWAGIGGLVGVAIGQAQEDDMLANCHVYGDGNCGPNTPWHGFVSF